MSIYEPTSDMRQMARITYDMYEAFLQAGFTDEQAFSMSSGAFLQALGLSIVTSIEDDD